MRQLTMGACVLGAIILSACSATHIVRPLPRGTSAWTTSLGGPFLPDAVPTKLVPYLSVGWQHGVTDDLTLGGAVHGTMAAFGVAGGELAATRQFASQHAARPAVAGTAQAYLFAGKGGARVYPSVGVVGSWRAGERALVYAGGNAIAQFSGTPALLINPLFGIQRTVTRRAALQAEFKWMAANADTRAGVFEGESSVRGRGVMALQLGLTLRRGRVP
ncbi:MAG: hypothetical protein IPP90_16275 [Gemmatimonadaceae bacterium]|nr:hypothetical protein [Gemmatimonadaceae bacterium]